MMLWLVDTSITAQVKAGVCVGEPSVGLLFQAWLRRQVRQPGSGDCGVRSSAGTASLGGFDGSKVERHTARRNPSSRWSLAAWAIPAAP